MSATQHLTVAKAALDRTPPWIQSADAVAAREADLLLARQNYDDELTLVRPFRGAGQLDQLAPFRSYRWVLPAWIRACLGLSRSADAERSNADYELMIERWPGGPTPSRLGWLRGLLAEMQGRPTAAQAHYAEDLGDPALPQVPFLHAQVLLDAGRLERVLNNRRGAVEHLGRARLIFAGLRAQPSLARCVTELVACGVPSTLTSPLGLVGREEDVAALVTRGYTIKEVGAELFLTTKAVEYHLSKIYSKLGVANRRELRQKRNSL